MKNILKTLLLIFVLCMTVVSAEEVSDKKTTVEIDVYIGHIKDFKVCNAEMALLNENKEQLSVVNVGIDATGVTKTVTFEVEEYTPGEEFYISFLNNIDCVQYVSDYYGIDSKILLETYSDYVDENSQIVKGNKFHITVFPLEQKKIRLEHNSNTYITQHPVKIVDGTCMISLVDIMDMFRLWQGKTSFDETGKLIIFGEDKNIEMTLWSTEAKNPKTVTLPVPPIRINTLMYVPLRFTAESLGAEVNVTTIRGNLYIDIVTQKSLYPEKEAFVNSKGISSKTGYLIWIDKSDFAVTVFQGSANNWKAINSYPCTIGKPSTPTITGQFEYYSKEKRWSYPKYYVGPIMRFYRGYAIHSTLVRYDGTPYDARLQKQLSLGCVRMAPTDIQYLWNTIPLYTKIYITE